MAALEVWIEQGLSETSLKGSLLILTLPLLPIPSSWFPTTGVF